ncbi:hypothetical protein HanIR_Chr11g0522541 [Helianthus annuus]|nr:hypothetical protein HanIR_Chr11g0522541 [Helianthus annuus]
MVTGLSLSCVFYGFLVLSPGSKGGPKPNPRWAGAPPGKKFSAKFRRKSRPHPLEFFVRTP